MKLFGFNVPLFRKGEEVCVDAKTHCLKLKDKTGHRLNPKDRYEWCEYPFITKASKGLIVSSGKFKLESGDHICYGVLIKGTLYAVKEDNLSKVV